MTDIEPMEFAIDQDRVEQYFRWESIIFPMIFPFIFPFAAFFGLGIVLAVIWWIKFRPGLAHSRMAALHYWIDEGGSLRVNQGVYFPRRLSIPLDRVSDIVIHQGPLMQMCGIWCLSVRSSGFQYGVASATLYGLRSPEKVRDLILTERRKLLSGMTERFV
jgi:membrane protein YdbS with pleckstrin-like domain